MKMQTGQGILEKSWKDLHAIRRNLQSSKSKGDAQLQRFIQWEGDRYKVPEVLGPRRERLLAKPSANVLQEEVKQLLEEKERLEHQITQLHTSRQSPHKQALQDRREKRKSSIIKMHLRIINKQEKSIAKMKGSIPKIQKRKRKIMDDCSKLQTKVAKLESEKEMKESELYNCIGEQISECRTTNQST